MENGSGLKKRIDYKWVIACVCFFMVFVSLGFCSSNKSMYVAAITEANGMSRGVFAFNDTCRFLSFAVINIFFGHLIGKFGTKKMIVFGFLSLIFSCFLYSVAKSVIVFYIGGGFLGLGLSFTTTAMTGCVINRWFKENIGTVMGAILCANGLGGALAAKIVYPIIDGETFGYQKAYRLIMIVLFAMMLIAAIFMREQPKGEAKEKATVAKKKPRGESWEGIDIKDARKRAFFWTTAICLALIGFMLHGINGVAATHMKDVSLDASYIVTVLMVHSVALTISKFLTGFIYDRLGLRFTFTLCSVSAIAAMLSLAVLSNDSFGKISAMGYSLISTLALPLETIMMPILVGDLFGQKSFNKILGLFSSINGVGFALGSPVMNTIYDKTGSYVLAFILCAVLMLIVATVMQIAIFKANKLKKAIVNEKESIPGETV